MAEFYIGVKINAQIQDALDLPVQHFFGKAIFRDAIAQHTSQFRHGFKNINLMAEPSKEIGTGESGRPATDNRNAFAGIRGRLDGEPFSGVHFIIGDKAFQLIDGYRFILDSTAAVFFTWMRAHATTGQQKRISLPDGIDGAFVVTCSNLCDILGDVDLGRACLTTGR